MRQDKIYRPPDLKPYILHPCMRRARRIGLDTVSPTCITELMHSVAHIDLIRISALSLLDYSTVKRVYRDPDAKPRRATLALIERAARELGLPLPPVKGSESAA